MMYLDYVRENLIGFSKLAPVWCGMICSIMGLQLAGSGDLYVDYSASPDPGALLSNRVCILHPDSVVSLQEGQERGNQFYAYLSLAEVAESAPYFDAVKTKGIPLLTENATWKSHVIDIRRKEWQDFFINTLGKKAAELGYDGFFIDTVDSIELLGFEKGSDAIKPFEDAIVEILSGLREAFPAKKIIVNRGFRFLPKLTGVIDGVLVESVFSTSDIEGTTTIPVDATTTKILLGEIEKTRKLGLATYVIDYVSPGDRETAFKTEKRIKELGCLPYISTRALNGTNVYEKKISRKILVIYGYDPEETEDHPVFPGDTLTLGILQASLEWKGYELDYHNISKGIPPLKDASSYCGLIVDETLVVPGKLEIPFAKWVNLQKEENRKILFLGIGNLSNETARDLLFGPFGVTFEGVTSRSQGEVTMRKVDDELMNFEVPTKPSREGFMAFQAPGKAEVLVSLEMKSDKGDVVRFDPVFIADWGACLLPPYSKFQISSEVILSHTDPFRFLDRIWPTGAYPVPDVTTKQGLRIFYSHIDGDGFVSVANFPGRPICGEVLYDEVLKDLPFPITVSIVEAELIGHMLSQVKPNVKLHESVAQKIFELPHVEPASHSYSHPFVWNRNDTSYFQYYDTLNLPLKLTTRYPKIVLDREIGGSLTYIENKLSGTDKPPKIFLWSGNCRPSAEALRLVREAGIENMNGGNTILSKRFPGIAAVAPKLVAEDGEIQIHASNQNEFYYTEGWKGPYFHGFAKVLETFEMTESPRRLKPVNVYYHFYSAERYDALLAVQKIYEWCEANELHLMTASHYAKMVRDSYHTQISELEPGKWKITNEGDQQTFRIPVSAGFPDLGDSDGVIGYRKFQDSWYIATNGSKNVVISFRDQELIHPHLVSSTEKVEVVELSTSSVELQNENRLRGSEITVGGLAKNGWVLTIGSGEGKPVPDKSRSISFQIPPGQSATIKRTSSSVLP